MARLSTAFLAAGLVCLSPVLFAYAGIGASASNELLDCTARIVHSRKADGHVLTELATMLSEFLRGKRARVELLHSVAQCQGLERAVAQNTPDSTNFYLAQISELPLSRGIKKLFSGFADTRHNCRQAGINWSYMYGLGVDISMDLAICRSTMGHRWLELRPSVELLAGLGNTPSVGAQYGWDTDERTSDHPISFSPRFSLHSAFMLASHITRRSSADLDTFGVGLLDLRQVNVNSQSTLKHPATGKYQGAGDADLSVTAPARQFVSLLRLALGIGVQTRLTVLRLENDYDYLYGLIHFSD